jgi:hypothetical protein
MKRRDFASSLLLCFCGGCLGAGEVLAQAKRSRRDSSAAVKPDVWSLYTNQRLGFQARFPQEPSVRVVDQSLFYAAFFSGHLLSVLVADAFRGTTVWGAATVRQFTQANAKIGLTHDFTRKVAPGILEYQGTHAEEKSKSRLIGRDYLTREIEYIVVVRAQPEAALDPLIARRFFAGFKLIPHPPLRDEARGRQQSNSYTPLYTRCSPCNGTGRIRTRCYKCGGFGQNSPSFWATEGRTCRWCYGSGYSSDYSCTSCGGSGQVRT